MIRLLLSVSVLLVISAAFGQAAPDTTKAKAAMAKLSYLLGEWKGSGWSQRGPERSTSDVREILTSELDGMAIVVKGRGTRLVNGKEEVVHNALGILSFNSQKNQYELKTWLATGNSADAWVELKEKGFDWGFDVPQGKIRYQMRIDENGRWIEKGEFSPDGKSWSQFFEMTLTRV